MVQQDCSPNEKGFRHRKGEWAETGRTLTPGDLVSLRKEFKDSSKCNSKLLYASGKRSGKQT